MKRGVWIGKELDVFIPYASLDLLFSFSWISVSPDDRYSVVPMVHRYEDETEDIIGSLFSSWRRGRFRLVDDAPRAGWLNARWLDDRFLP